MIEPRLTSVVLLDGSQLDFLITPEFMTGDLMDMVCAHLTLTDKEYFGLSFIDQTGHRNWLQMEKRILDHDLPKKNGVLILFFSVKFYIESIAYTKDKNAVELFFLQARLLIYQGDLEINNELIFELGALVLQSLFGDYKNEPKIIGYYKKCSSLNRGQCIVNYLSIIEKLCNYGVHYYEVKDKTSSKWYLGVSYRGIGLYESTNKIIPKKIFPWSKLENLYYRDRKFSIEVHESQSVNSNNSNSNSLNHSPSSNCINGQKHLNNSQNNLQLPQTHSAQTQSLQQQQQLLQNPLTQQTQQTDESFNPVKVYAWFASIPSLCKSIWLMAVAQHQFYLDKKQNRHNILQFKSLNDLALELNNITSNQQSKFNVENIDDLSHTNKSKAANTNKIALNQKNSEENSRTELLNLFKKQKEILLKNIEIKKKQYELIKTKQNDVQEITQQSLTDKSQINKLLKILMEFRNTNLNSKSSLNSEKNTLIDNICLESEIQKKVMFITLNLASDPHVSYIVQKQRREFYEKSKKKLAKLEKKLEKETGSTKNMLIDSNKSNLTIPERNEMNHHSHSDLKLKQIDENCADISPASIHRKDSYRRAQEQKLFLDASDTNILNKQNRFIAARKVKTILNNEPLSNNSLNSISDNNLTQLNTTQPITQPQAPQHFVPTPLSQMQETNIRIIKLGNNNLNSSTNSNNSQNSSQNLQNGFHSGKNSIAEEQIKDGLLIDTQPKQPINDLILNNESMNTTNGFSTSRPNNFYLNEDFLDLESSLNKTCNNSMALNNHHHFHQTSNLNLPSNNMTDFITFRNQRNQRKNTSDSNVKLLADHNFYHVTNRRHANNHNEIRENYACPDLVEPNSSILKNGIHLNNSQSKVIAKPYELSDYFKYNSKFKRGMNSSSNSLISLNSSSVGTNEDSGNNNSDKDVMRSNPDLKINSLVNSPNSIGQQQQQQQVQQQNGKCLNSTSENLKYENYFSNSFKSDLTNLSNNLSLNLSIHTAEEFGIEMLEWLNNESVSINAMNHNGNQNGNGYLLDKEFAIDSKLATNATLV